MSQDEAPRRERKPKLGERLMRSKLVNAFYVFDVDDTADDTELGVDPPMPTSPAVGTSTSHHLNFYEELRDELDSDNDALTKYKAAYQAMHKVSVEDERRAAALAMLQMQGHPLVDLLKAIDSDRARLETEVEECLAEHLSAQQQAFDAKRQEIAEDEAAILTRQQQIASHQAEIDVWTREEQMYAQKREQHIGEAAMIERGMGAIREQVARARDQLNSELGRLRAILSK